MQTRQKRREVVVDVRRGCADCNFQHCELFIPTSLPIFLCVSSQPRNHLVRNIKEKQHECRICKRYDRRDTMDAESVRFGVFCGPLRSHALHGFHQEHGRTHSLLIFIRSFVIHYPILALVVLTMVVGFSANESTARSGGDNFDC